MPEHGDGLQAEMAPHPIEVLDLGSEADVPDPDAIGRPAATALVVVEETERLCEAVQLRQEVGVVEVWPAVHHHDRLSLADVATEQPEPVGGHVCLARIHRRKL